MGAVGKSSFLEGGLPTRMINSICQQIGFPEARIVFLLSSGMGNVLHPSDWLHSASHSAACVEPGSFMDLEDKACGWASAEVGGSIPMKTLSANRECGRPHSTANFAVSRNEKCNSVSSTLLCPGQHG